MSGRLSKRKKCKCGCGEEVNFWNDYKKWHSLRNLKPHEFPAWKGGSYRYWHEKAFEMFGKDKCERCNNEANIQKRLCMHNTLNPKDHTIMEAYAWQTLCDSCHVIIEWEIRGRRRLKRS